MSKGNDRRINDLENFEAEFAEALARAKAEKFSAYISEKQGARRGAATQLDVELFTLESKIDRLREKLGLPPFVVPIKPNEKPASATEGWPMPPELEATAFALDLAQLHLELAQSGRTPEALFAKVKYASAKHRQGADQTTWRLAMVEVGDGRVPAKLALTVYPLPDHPDAALAAQKLAEALERLVAWCEKNQQNPSAERPRLMHVAYSRGSRELAFHAR